MATNIYDYANSYSSPYAGGYNSVEGLLSLSNTQQNAKVKADQLLNTYNKNKESVKTLKADTAKYLDSYVLSMKTMDQSAGKLRNGGMDKLLFDSEGEVTDKTVEDTVKVAKAMVDDYNATLKLLNDNAKRGPGTVKQLGRMATDPAPAAGLKMVGVTINKDGTLALDSDKMTEALKTTDKNQLNLYKDILGGYGGLADGVHLDALFGQGMPARELIGNDIASIQQTKRENPFTELYLATKGNVYQMNNQAVAGMMMNLLV